MAWTLFKSISGEDIPQDQLAQLIKMQPDSKAVKNIGDHHLFELLAYNPKAIKTAALLYKENKNINLATLYQMIR
jgi:hypothetical protein